MTDNNMADNKRISEDPQLSPNSTNNLPHTGRLSWRVVDIIVASVIGVVSAFVYWGGSWVYEALKPLFAFIPGTIGLVDGVFLLAGPLAAVIVRKPGAAIYAELVGAVLEALLGNAWGGAETIVSGLIQGLGAELIFLFCLYRVWNWLTCTLSGLLSGLACYIGYAFLGYLQGDSLTKKMIEGTCTCVSGALLAGLVMWFLYVAIARTGALDRFASGRIIRQNSR
ncbi:Hydroxymethylpyrimidine transport system permease protein [Scardovia inopinata]|uniref:Uncharacterized protein n=1 Tax=Scardovia inopinata F0304 TaxID=641146 RepID=W5IIX3_SCAIO|nr:ECF transporter S component [Scardovia inopinata]EFG26956.2 hypothetical protein HMPREF9020_00586 [Scardovia inopinata F0304]SUV52079.1 Hydroxymethylpyrimidine transport system permease protein [Scardovia inopinata]